MDDGQALSQTDILNEIFIFSLIALQELVYIWNGFMVLAQCPELLEAVSQRVDAAFQYVQSDACKMKNQIFLWIIVINPISISI